jgi:cytochrome c oxidase subunit 4
MKKEETHISSYTSHTIVLIVLLSLTTISVLVTGWHLGALTVTVALALASIKVSIVITYFMHVKFESLFLKLMIAGVFVIYALVIIITFIDYYLR